MSVLKWYLFCKFVVFVSTQLCWCSHSGQLRSVLWKDTCITKSRLTLKPVISIGHYSEMLGAQNHISVSVVDYWTPPRGVRRGCDFSSAVSTVLMGTHKLPVLVSCISLVALVNEISLNSTGGFAPTMLVCHYEIIPTSKWPYVSEWWVCFDPQRRLLLAFLQWGLNHARHDARYDFIQLKRPEIFR